MSKILAYGCPAVWILLIGCSCVGCGKPPAEPAQTAEVPIPTAEIIEEPANQIEAPAVPADPVIEPSTDETAPEPTSEESEVDTFEELEPPEPPRLPPPEGADAMPEPNLVWVDRKLGLVMVDGYVSLREGMLEMFACPVGTKEHESIVAVYSRVQIIHAALLAIGAEVGSPVQFDPEFKPPTGTEIAIEILWLDEAGNWQAADAQQWILDLKTEQPMTHPWVFAGSRFLRDEETGDEYYMAERGEFVCVSNFSTAMLDIPVESSDVNEGLLFEANPANIPPLGTPVRLVLKPKLE